MRPVGRGSQGSAASSSGAGTLSCEALRVTEHGWRPRFLHRRSMEGPRSASSVHPHRTVSPSTLWARAPQLPRSGFWCGGRCLRMAGLSWW